MGKSSSAVTHGAILAAAALACLPRRCSRATAAGQPGAEENEFISGGGATSGELPGLSRPDCCRHVISSPAARSS